MTVVADKVFNEALSLPSDARMSLVEKLLTSLNLPTHADIDLLWASDGYFRLIKAMWRSFQETKYSLRSAGSTSDEIPISSCCR
jgi:hypothetical protein